MGARVAALLVVLLALAGCGAAGPAAPASPGLSVVHRELVQAGPYPVTVGFTEWPMRAERSLDVVFLPEPGVDRVSGTLTRVSPSGQVATLPLLRHPKMRSAYGLDIVAFREQGTWLLRFDLQGPQGPGSGVLAVDVGERPGVPVLVGWLPTLGILGVMVAAVALAWYRHRPGRRPQARSWGTAAGSGVTRGG